MIFSQIEVCNPLKNENNARTYEANHPIATCRGADLILSIKLTRTSWQECR